MNGHFQLLLADDDEDDRFFFKDIAQTISPDLDIQTVNDGKQLMDKLKKYEEPQPGIIFLDINMPLKGGKECLDEIRRDSKLKHLVVAIFSTSTNVRDIQDTYDKGADLYIQKPNNFGDLKTIIMKVINMKWQPEHHRLSRDNFFLDYEHSPAYGTARVL